MVYRRVLTQDMEVVQAGADAVGEEDACMNGVAQNHVYGEEMRLTEEDTRYYGQPQTLFEEGVR
jgi:hypothetical protein